MVDDPVVEVLTTLTGVTGGGLDLEDTLLDREERYIEGPSTEIEGKGVPLALDLLVETVGDGGGVRLIDNTEDVETSDETSVLDGLTLRVVEEYAGTVTTARLTDVPMNDSAVSLIFWRTIEEHID